MRRYRLRDAMLLIGIGVIAASLALGSCMERDRHRASSARPKAAAKPKAFTYHIGAFW